MSHKPLLTVIGTTLVAFTACFAAQPEWPDAFTVNRQLGRGVNLSALEAPREGAWGVMLKQEYFEVIKEAGFDSVRIPIRFNAHAAEQPPYTIDPQFFERVDWAVDNALSRNLCAIIDFHHYEALFEQPAEHKERFCALWDQIARRYSDRPPTLLFELLNEPHGKLTPALWNEMLAEALATVRKSNPHRTIIVAPANWNQIDFLDRLELPGDDRNIIVSFHYYRPFHFTHQGAGWVGGDADKWLGTKWTGSAEEKQEIAGHFDKALGWSKETNRPINLGEFGAYSKADMASRARWTAFVAQQADERNFSRHYWEFCAGFGVYDRKQNKWRKPLLSALLPDSTACDTDRQTEHNGG